jgi:hypothetical protein
MILVVVWRDHLYWPYPEGKQTSETFMKGHFVNWSKVPTEVRLLASTGMLSPMLSAFKTEGS